MLFISTLIKGVFRYVKYSEEEQDAEDFEEIFVQDFIGKGKRRMNFFTEKKLTEFLLFKPWPLINWIIRKK